MENKKLDCKHIWEKIANWDGINIETETGIGGYWGRCIICNEEKCFTHDEWQILPDNSKFNRDCQSCGKRLEYKILGINKDLSKNTEYCINCFRNGKFTEPNLTLKQMVKKVAKIKSTALNLPEKKIEKAETEFIGTLKRWQSIKKIK